MNRFYLVQSRCPKYGSFTWETNEDSQSEATLVREIAEGQYDAGLIDRILMVDVAASAVVDVTQIVAEQVSSLSDRDQRELPSEARELVERFGFDHFDAGFDDGSRFEHANHY